MNWITNIFVAFMAIAHDNSWFATDPAASFALAEAHCMLPTPHCLCQAKIVHARLVQEHLEAYWGSVNEERAGIEQEKQARKTHDLYVAQQLAKGDKWDKWELDLQVTFRFDSSSSTAESQRFQTPRQQTPTFSPSIDKRERDPARYDELSRTSANSKENPWLQSPGKYSPATGSPLITSLPATASPFPSAELFFPLAPVTEEAEVPRERK
ncbi:hypothetical protein E8E12_003159 [Didymella heteroderae]|uniref:Uncharacterized protein n=1 Tax=Didymella heteroderae TaxID=1769908 RepID=A0A9P4WU89_9PLEO|nr:hypothetical protein E8E12_003159 [Didymella heteroderae]